MRVLGTLATAETLAATIHAFAPRLGLAYSMNEKTVIRMGFGVSYDIGVFGSNFGHAVTQNLPVLAHQHPTAPTRPIPGASNGSSCGIQPGEWADSICVPRLFRTAEFSPWEARLGTRNRLFVPRPDSACYRRVERRHPTADDEQHDVGYRVRRQLGRHWFNGDDPSCAANPINIQNWALTNPCLANPTLREPVQPDRQYGPAQVLLQQTRYIVHRCHWVDDQCAMLRPVTLWGNVSATRPTTSYNALQVKVHRHMSHGLQFIAHYTWSSALGYYHDGGYFAANPRVASMVRTIK